MKTFGSEDNAVDTFFSVLAWVRVTAPNPLFRKLCLWHNSQHRRRDLYHYEDRGAKVIKVWKAIKLFSWYLWFYSSWILIQNWNQKLHCMSFNILYQFFMLHFTLFQANISYLLSGLLQIEACTGMVISVTLRTVCIIAVNRSD